jgi:hypothetical protein
MKIDIFLQDANPEKIIPVLFSDDDTLESLINQIEQVAEIDGSSIVGMAADLAQLPDYSTQLKTFKFKHPAVHVRRVCVKVHFEGDEAKHFFPARAPWSRVHRWACRKFGVAHAAAANLELHEGSPTGPVLNERKDIGASDECKEVWLVKPGPENNG